MEVFKRFIQRKLFLNSTYREKENCISFHLYIVDIFCFSQFIFHSCNSYPSFGDSMHCIFF